MNAFHVIQNKQSGAANTEEEILFMVRGAMDDRVEEAQLSAWFMAIYFRGMTPEETWTLTRAMLESGRVLHTESLKVPRVDKHSTGGVGDKVTFILGPILAACDLALPTITGRGLGHTGGTVDKLECLPGIELGQTQDDMLRILKKTGLCILRQTEDLVPADRLFYALRDVTATVESVPLICGSILSKKLAEGLDYLVLDVKCGSGAIYKTEEKAAELASALVSISAAGKRRAGALLTAMDVPLGRQVGNWNELVESVECLQGHGPADLMEVCYALGAATLMGCGRCQDLEEALLLQQCVVKSGRAFEILLETIALQGGDNSWLKYPHRAPKPTRGLTVTQKKTGTLSRLDALTIGRAALALGAGRERKEDDVDPLAGVTLHCKPGDVVKAGTALADVYCSRESGKLEEAADLVRQAYATGPGLKESEQSGEMILRCIGLDFSPEEWRACLAKVGLNLKTHPLWSL